MLYLIRTKLYAKFGGFDPEVIEKSDNRRHNVLLPKVFKNTGCIHVNITGSAKAFKFYKKKYFCKVNEKYVLQIMEVFLSIRGKYFYNSTEELFFFAFTIKK